MSEITCLEDCLIALGSKKPFLKEPKIDCDNCIQPFTLSGMIAYDKLRNILSFLMKQNIIKEFNEDLLDQYADGVGIY